MTNLTRDLLASGDDKRLTRTVEEAATLLGVGRTLAYQMARDGRLPTRKLGARRVVPLEAIERLLAGREAEAKTTIAD